ncbi:MAG TPA: type II toxin-antitoxin system RelE/ParE family toxin [Planctomycetes bacterium]|nr:type II toxin-antitoxin system RelE/ParE family toxin [Planctomycetota bacterium]
MGQVIWTETALSDLRGIVEYIAKDSPIYAERFGTRLVRAPRLLEKTPLLGRMVPEYNDASIREIIFGAYRVIYKATEHACLILAIIHGSRDIIRHLEPGAWDIEP